MRVRAVMLMCILLTQIMALTHNRGVDMVVEMLANANLGKDLTVLADGGVCT